MDNSLTVLVDNRAEEPLKSEHGYSILIEWNGKRVLFDTAEFDSLYHNTKQMEIPLDNLDILVLSHGHHDHGGNLAEVLEMNPGIKVYAHPECLNDRFSVHKDGKAPFIGLSEKDRKALLSLPDDRIVWCRDSVEILPGFRVSGTIPRVYGDEDTGGDFYTEKECLHPDPLYDDMSIWLDTADEITIISGCCHSGLRNTVDHILSISEKKNIRILMGGFHLLHAGEKRVSDTIDYLNNSNIRQLIPAHCTGEKAMKRFQEELSCKVTLSLTGLKVSLD